MQELIKDLVIENGSKIVFLVLDGVGGLPWNKPPYEGKTELEAATIPNMDSLARKSACGLHTPVAMGITPGSGPGHLGFFGYDPKEFKIGRGILEALGLGMEVRKTDIAVRCNYATVEGGIVKDRRAGRVATIDSAKITARLAEAIKKIDDVEIIFGAGMEHRFAVLMRFPTDLEAGSSALNDTDPQQEGLPPKPLHPTTKPAEKVAVIAKKFIEQVAEVLKNEPKTNFALMRGFSQKPNMPSFKEAYGLNALAIANYPMYRGLAMLVGMKSPEIKGDIREEIDFLKANYDKYDFFFVHIKKVDSYGEDGNFESKKKKIEEVDTYIQEILSLKPDVLVVTGDHSTPALKKGHSWHPVPVMVHAKFVLGDMSQAFSERECFKGELGVFPSVNLMPLVLANAGRLNKYGA